MAWSIGEFESRILYCTMSNHVDDRWTKETTENMWDTGISQKSKDQSFIRHLCLTKSSHKMTAKSIAMHLLRFPNAWQNAHCKPGDVNLTMTWTQVKTYLIFLTKLWCLIKYGDSVSLHYIWHHYMIRRIWRI